MKITTYTFIAAIISAVCNLSLGTNNTVVTEPCPTKKLNTTIATSAPSQKLIDQYSKESSTTDTMQESDNQSLLASDRLLFTAQTALIALISFAPYLVPLHRDNLRPQLFQDALIIGAQIPGHLKLRP